MPNGRPGDNPLTDLLVHDSVVFGEPIDGFVRNMSKHRFWSEVQVKVGDLLWESSADRAGAPDVEREALMRQLHLIDESMKR